jgi:hypothetical protein
VCSFHIQCPLTWLRTAASTPIYLSNISTLLPVFFKTVTSLASSRLPSYLHSLAAIMNHDQPTAYEPFTRTGHTIQEHEHEHPELGSDEQRLIQHQNSRRQRAQKSSTSPFSAFVRGVSLCIAITVVVIQSTWLSVLFRTRNDIIPNPQDHFKPKAWPAVLDIKPTYIMLGVAALTIVFQLLAILTHVGPVSAEYFDSRYLYVSS